MKPAPITYTVGMHRGARGGGEGHARWAVLASPSNTWVFPTVPGRRGAEALARRLTADEVAGDFRVGHMPEGPPRLIAEAIVRLLRKRLGRAPTGGGCLAFRSRDKHVAMGEKYGRDAVLILVHDGGDLAPCCNLDYEDPEAEAALVALLEGLGFRMEPCTNYYTAVYPLG